MKRILLTQFLLFSALFLLSACSSEQYLTPTSPVVIDPILPVTPTSEITCSSIITEPTAAPGPSSLFPPVSQADFSIGPEEAAVTIIEYCDFQSQGCNEMSSVIGELMRNHDDLRFIFRPLPLIGILDKSERSVIAALAADQQGKFWEMYDLLFVNNASWANLNPSQFDSWVVSEAVKAGMDGDQLQSAIKAGETKTHMMSMYDEAKKLSIPAVPLILINGTLQPSYVLDYQNMSDTIGLIALGQKQFTECPPFNIDATKQYLATIKTGKGDIVIQLMPEKAPLAVNSFIFLARQGWFDGVTFHRVIPGFLAQSGDPSETGKGNAGYFYNNEITDLKFDKPGVVGMVNSGPDTNGSQFFITYSPAPHLDGIYTIFGQVINGLDVAENLTPRDPQQSGALPAGDKIISVVIEEK